MGKIFSQHFKKTSQKFQGHSHSCVFGRQTHQLICTASLWDRFTLMVRLFTLETYICKYTYVLMTHTLWYKQKLIFQFKLCKLKFQSWKVASRRWEIVLSWMIWPTSSKNSVAASEDEIYDLFPDYKLKCNKERRWQTSVEVEFILCQRK